MEKYFLAIDYGEKKCGLALAENENKIATAYKIIPTALLVDEIRKISEQRDFAGFIIGKFGAYSLYQSKHNGKIKNLAQELNELFGAEVFFQDEVFSSKLAQKNLVKAKKSASQDDAESARIILQDWLDKKKK